MFDISTFETLKTQVLACHGCQLAANRQHVVFGEGNPEGGILVIGEGPGAEEDKTGRPFVGRSGKLLDKILASAGFTREQHVFIANIVKCRPPNNRAPLPEERAACMPYLEQQIELINPKIIILLGATALNALISPDLRITKARGKWIEWHGRLVMPMFHPSALLRNPNLKKDTWVDIQAVFHKYKELIDPNHRSEYISE